ncbi:glycosyltransferase family 4 protein [Winogradskyella sp.]|uniref:glycosyltransferase family 4 protein n=1 Tax=Winogradskyella sp. TaxID=1883156 RepID=UPI003BAC16AB
MKVLHCINRPQIGGMERLVIDLASEQKSLGLDVFIMLDVIDGHYLEDILNQNIPILESGVRGGFDANANTFYKLKKVFNGFEIIHLHSFSLLITIAALSSWAKTVYTIHGLSKGVRRENLIKYFFRESLKKMCLNKLNYFIANSESTLSKAEIHYGLKNVNRKVILNGVKIGPLLPSADFKIPKEIFTIGLVSRFTPRKRIDRLLSAFAIFKKKGFEGRLIMVGDGINFNNIKQQVETMKLESHVDMVGYKRNVDDYYKKFHVCVQPSDNEGFGLVAVEAYLHGLPMIAFKDSGGLVEVVKPIEPDNLVEDEEHLAERLGFYFSNQHLIADAADQRMTYAKNHFSIHRMGKDYLKVYNELT